MLTLVIRPLKSSSSKWLKRMKSYLMPTHGLVTTVSVKPVSPVVAVAVVISLAAAEASGISLRISLVEAPLVHSAVQRVRHAAKT